MKIGIDLGGSHIAIGVVNENGKIVGKIEKSLKGIEKESIKRIIEETIIENVNCLRKKYNISNIGVAIPGTIKEDVVIKSVNLGLENYEIVKQLKEKLDLPISIRNDAKCAAIAEKEYGCLKKYDRGIFLTLGTGIGGAVIINDKLLDTGDLPGCEFGHMIIEKNGIQCSCGRKGCFEKYASMKAFKDSLRKTLGYSNEVTGKELFMIIKNIKVESEEYKKIENVIAEYIDNLSIGIANLINIFEPEAIGIGGSFVYFEEILLEKLINSLLEENKIFNPRKKLIIKTATLGNDAGIIGAIL